MPELSDVPSQASAAAPAAADEAVRIVPAAEPPAATAAPTATGMEEALARLEQAEAWKAIARLSRDIAAMGEVEPRTRWIERFARGLWGVREARWFPIARNLIDMQDRPARGAAAFWEYVAQLGHPVIVDGGDLQGLSKNQELPALIEDPRWRTFLIAPVLTPGRAVGVLVLAEDTDREFTDEDVERLEAVVPQIGSALDAVQLAEENRYKDAYSRALGDIDMMIASYDVTEILRHGVRKIHETVDVEKVLVYIVNQETGAVRLSVAEGVPALRDHAAGPDACALLAHQALKERRSRLVGKDEIGAVAGLTERQGIVTPIMANNQMYGVLEVFDKRNGRPFHRNEVAFVNQVALKLALVIQNTHAYLTINRLNESLEQKVTDRTGQLEQAITSLQETQAQLMQSEKMATIGTLAGGVAHEINNPLAAILANVQLLRLDVEDEEQLESLDIIEDGAKRCKHIVEGLLNYSRRATPEQRSLSVNVIMKDTLDMLGHQLKHANVKLDLHYGEVSPVIGVATEIGQVFTNLVVNAIDAMVELRGMGGPNHMSVRTGQDGRLVWVEVADDGPGMEEHVLRKVFDPFFTTKQVGRGTGLGLSVSQQIASSLGGHVEARSIPGQGATFRMILPSAHGGGTGPLG